MTTSNSNTRGAAALVLAMLIFSLQDVAVKWIEGARWLSGDERARSHQGLDRVLTDLRRAQQVRNQLRKTFV